MHFLVLGTIWVLGTEVVCQKDTSIGEKVIFPGGCCANIDGRRQSGAANFADLQQSSNKA